MIDKSLADKLTSIAVQQFETGMKFKRQRMLDIQKSEEFYYGKKKKSLVRERVARLPIMSGFVDTLLSKIDDPPTVNFGWTDIADYKRARKVQAAWERDSDTNHGNWGLKDRWEKKLAIFSGRGIAKIYSESYPEYQHHYDVIDHNNFVCEPKGGGHLKNHAFMGEQNIWRTRHQLEQGARDGIYDPHQLSKLVSAMGDDEYKKNDEIYTDTITRYQSLGLDMETNTYMGVPIFRLVEWYMAYHGTWYYLLFDYKTGIWLRAEKLTDIFESGLIPYVSWATHPDAGNFWSKAPADDARPLCDIIDSLFTQELINREKINQGMKGWDPEMIPNPSQLLYRPDGLVEINRRDRASIKEAIYEFQTPSFKGTIDLINYIDAILGMKSGVTPATQGVAPEKKVGIYFGNLQQVADRLGLYNKSYKEAWAEKGLRYYYGLKEHCPEKMMVKMIGSEGIEWEELTKDDTNPISDFDITITGGLAEEQMNLAKKKEKKDALLMIQKDPLLASQVNPQWRLKQLLQIAGWDEADIKMALNKGEGLDMELLSEANQVIQDIILGKEPKKNRAANVSFLRYLLNYAYQRIDFDKVEGERKEQQKTKWFNKIIAYIKEHIPIAIENMGREAILSAVKPVGLNLSKLPNPQPAPETEISPLPQPGEEPKIPVSQSEALSQSQRVSRALRGQAASEV